LFPIECEHHTRPQVHRVFHDAIPRVPCKQPLDATPVHDHAGGPDLSHSRLVHGERVTPGAAAAGRYFFEALLPGK
jgi:hypothetical protein